MAARSSRHSVDTLDSSTDAAGSAFDHAREGGSEIALSASEALPAAGGFIGRAVYNTTYAVSFGVTVPVMLVARVIPRDNALVHGLVDGAMAARDRVYDGYWDTETDHHDGEDDVMDASSNGVDHHDEEPSSSRATHRRPKAKRAATTRKAATRSSRKKS